MIAAVSLMRRSEAVSLATFRRHWLDVHGPLVCRFPGLRDYVQHHVVASPAMNAPARGMNIDGFPILLFDNEADRRRAHASPEMAACNEDSRSFIGAVSRVICEQQVVIPQVGSGRLKLIALLPGNGRDGAALEQYAAWAQGLPRLSGLALYRVLEQGPAPNSVIPHLPINVAGLAALSFPSLVDLECAVATDGAPAAHFVVEEHRLV
jgi:uncharacterized protein (TIGR02118 family)